MLELGTLETTVRLLGLTLLHFLWQGLVLWLIFSLLMRALTQATALTRYYCALGTLGMMLLVPVITFGWLSSSQQPVAGGALGTITADSVFSVVTGTSRAAGSWLNSLELLPLLAIAWFAGVLLLAVRMVIDARYLLWLKRSVEPAVPDALAAAMTRLCERLELAPGRIGIGITPHVSAALVVGWLRPMILLPAAIIAHLPQRQLELVLAHELAHIRRFDPLVNFFQAVVETLLFYHPAVRLVSRRIRVERENCTDDLVVKITRDRLGYARALTALEELRDSSLRLSVGIGDGDLAQRIRRLFRVEPKRQRGMLGAGLILVVTTVFSLLAGLGVSHLSQWRDAETVAPEARELAPVPAAEGVPEPRADQVRRPEPVELVASGEISVQREPVQDEAVQTESVQNERPLNEIGEIESAPYSEPERVAEPAPEKEIAEIEPPLPTVVPNSEPIAESVSVTDNDVAEVADKNPAATTRPVLEDAPVTLTNESNEVPDLPEPELESALAMVPTRPGRDESIDAAAAPAVTGGRLLHMEPPEYPRRAMRRGVETEIRLSFVVDVAGKPRDIEILDGDHERYRFGRAAERAVSRWRFEPFAQDGRPVEKRVEQVVGFKLSDQTIECVPSTGSRLNSRRRQNSC